MADGERLAFEQMLVHNLKAPLTGILASLEMLRDGDLGPLNPAQRDAVSGMQAQGAVLERMIGELLDLGLMESSTFKVQRVPVNTAELLGSLRTEWLARLPRLTSKVSPGVPDLVADPEVLKRVLDNLLMNVLVHAGPDAAVGLQAEQSGDVVRLTVTDDGPGVPAADADRIFEPFVTLPGGSRRTHGLGLAYSRAALAAMGGTITLVPGGRGATFAVELPATVALTRQALEQEQ